MPPCFSILITLLVFLFWSPFSTAAEGPGFPNVDYLPGQEGSVLSLNDYGKALSAMTMHRGYLFVPLGADHGGGRGAGAFALYDISDPTNVVEHFDTRRHGSVYNDRNSINYVGNFAEVHHMCASGNLMMITERRSGSSGFCFLDLSNIYDDDPATLPQIVGRYSYPGLNTNTNYDGWAFAAGMQGTKYHWGPTGANGLFVVDTSDITNPQLVTHLPTSQLNNNIMNAAVPIGNLLILSSSAVSSSFDAIVMDISDPANPQILNTFNGPLGYQGFTYGSKFYGGGEPLRSHDFSNPQNIVTTTLERRPNFDRSEYGFGKDNHIFIGHYPGMTKWEISGNTATRIVDVNSGIVDDHAFITPLGNLIALSSDHNNGRRMIFGIHDQKRA